MFLRDGLLGGGHHEFLHHLNGLVHQTGWLSEVVFTAEPHSHTPVTGVEPSGISDTIRAHCGHWAIAQENSGFSVLRAYHASGGRQGWKYVHWSMTRGELDKAAETPRDEKGDAACSVR